VGKANPRESGKVHGAGLLGRIAVEGNRDAVSIKHLIPLEFNLELNRADQRADPIYVVGGSPWAKPIA
jgi:hypothetical protein